MKCRTESNNYWFLCCVSGNIEVNKEESPENEIISLEDLPLEIIASIFKFLPARDLPKCELLSKRCKAAITQFRSYFPRPFILLNINFDYKGEFLFGRPAFSIRLDYPEEITNERENWIRNYNLLETGEISFSPYSTIETNTFPPENGVDLDSATKSFFKWYKWNIKTIYSKWGPSLKEIPSIPHLKLDEFPPDNMDLEKLQWFIDLLKKKECLIDTLHVSPTYRPITSIRIAKMFGEQKVAHNIEVSSEEKESVSDIITFSQLFENCTILKGGFDNALFLIRDLKEHWSDTWNSPKDSISLRIRFPVAYHLPLHSQKAKPLKESLSLYCANLKNFPLIQFPDKIPDLMIFENPHKRSQKFTVRIARQNKDQFRFAHLAIDW